MRPTDLSLLRTPGVPAVSQDGTTAVVAVSRLDLDADAVALAEETLRSWGLGNRATILRADVRDSVRRVEANVLNGVDAEWLTPDEVRASAARHRSPLVLRCIEDYLAGVRLPLSAVYVDPAVKSLEARSPAAV